MDYRSTNDLSNPVIEALERNGGKVSSNRELAALMQVSEGEATKRVNELGDRLYIVRKGREKLISVRGRNWFLGH